jgi:hypothetical protein
MSGEIILGTFSLTLLYSQIMTIKYRVNNDRTMTEVYMTLVSHLISARNDYFKKNNKNIFDQTIFRDFIVECIGESINPEREVALRFEARRKNNKRAYYSYEPEKDKEPETNYNFSNVSGNEIKNPKNLRLTEYNAKSENEIEEEFEPEPEIPEIKPTENAPSDD